MPYDDAKGIGPRFAFRVEGKHQIARPQEAGFIRVDKLRIHDRGNSIAGNSAIEYLVLGHGCVRHIEAIEYISGIVPEQRIVWTPLRHPPLLGGHPPCGRNGAGEDHEQDQRRRAR